MALECSILPVCVQTALVDMLYELFCIREGDGGSVLPSDGHRNKHTSTECAEWDSVVASHLRTPPHEPSTWALYEGFLAAEAKGTLPHLARCR